MQVNYNSTSLLFTLYHYPHSPARFAVWLVFLYQEPRLAGISRPVCNKSSTIKTPVSPEKTKEPVYKCSQNTHPFPTNPMLMLDAKALLLPCHFRMMPDERSDAAMPRGNGGVAIYQIFQISTRGSLIPTIALA